MKLDLNLSLGKLKLLYSKAKDAYYEDSAPVLTDAQFDTLEDFLKEKDPKWEGFKAGAPVKNKKTKVKLPIPMFSLDKKKADNIDSWLGDQRVPNTVISDKLDGSALEIEYVVGKPIFCATRGNGKIGQEVSYLIPHLRIPQKVGTSSFIIRCEGLFGKAGFQKYKHEFDAARNAASGILNTQGVHHAIKDLKIVVLQVLKPNLQPSKGLKWAKSKGFTVVPFQVVQTKKINANNLSRLLDKRKASSKFEMDGLVLTLDQINKQPTSGNPEWSIAFKKSLTAEEAPVTTIRSVEWEVSAHGLIKPVVVYDPLDWEGSTLTRASAYNAKYVNTNGIGPGAKVALIRSGEIIPKIIKVLKKAKPSVPSPKIFGSYHLTKNDTDYVLDAPLENEDFRVKKISRFFTNIGVDFLKERTVRKLYAAGFTNVKSITKATPKDFLKVPGVKETIANKVYNNIHKVIDAGIPLITLMDASGVFPFGMGSTRLENIAEKYDLLKLCALPEKEQRAILVKIPGFKEAAAEYFIKGSKKFLKWVRIVGIKPTQPKKVRTKLESTKLNGLSLAWTGYRDKEQEAIVIKNGGSVDKFGAKTSVLLVIPTGKASSKSDKAKEKGIPVMTWDKFVHKYGLVT
jgi:DNA ligase (NAD+)